MSEETQATAEPLVTYEQRGAVALITMNRPGVRNAQNADMTFQLDNAFLRAVNDDSVGAIILAGAGDHFSAGHDIGTPLRDIHRNFERRATTYWPHEDKAGAEAIFVREAELYVGMCRRWRELPKPTIAMSTHASKRLCKPSLWDCGRNFRYNKPKQHSANIARPTHGVAT